MLTKSSIYKLARHHLNKSNNSSVGVFYTGKIYGGQDRVFLF
jgi:hypothetical protein